MSTILLHRLKSYVPRFELLASGVTSAEVRENRGRNFAVGDHVVLLEGVQEIGLFRTTGRVILAEISNLDTLWVNDGCVLISYKDLRLYS